MVTASNTRQTGEEFERYIHNAFNIGLLITIASILVIAGTAYLQYRLGENYYIWITAVGVVGGILAMVFARLRWLAAASIALIGSLMLVAMLYVFLIANVATNLTIIMVVLCLGIAIQTIPSKYLTWSIVVILVLGVGLIVLDQFWPGARNVPPPQTENIIALTGAAMILVLVVIVVRQFPTYSLRGKLIGATLAVAFVAVAAVAVGVNFFTSQLITNQVGQNLNTLAASQSLVIGEFLAREVNALEALSTNQIIIEAAQNRNREYDEDETNSPSRQIAIKSGEWARALEGDEIISAVLENDASFELQKFKQLFPENTELTLTDKYGAQVGATRRSRDYYKGDDTWWTSAYVDGFGSVYIGEPEFKSDYGGYVITISVPVHGKNEDGGGETVGVLNTVVDLDVLSDILIDSEFGETGTISIYLNDGRHMIIDQNFEINVNDTDFDETAVDYIKNPTEPFIVTVYENTEHFLSATFINTLTHEPAIDRLRWLVLAAQHTEEILEPLTQQRRLNTILGIIVVLTSGTVAAFVGQRISKPIMNLTQTAEEVARGNLQVEAPIETQDEIGLLAASFNVMTAQLRESINTLEQRVADRTQALATSVVVGRQLSTILARDELVTAVVNQVRDAFDYYQAQIYLLADDGSTLVMAGGTGKAGEKMLADGHQLQVGTGLVGRAAETNQVILVSDVTKDKNWLPNPLLPDTKSETAVPIAIGEKVLGVLDVQHNTVNGLQPEDTELLQSVANQVAVALRNAQLYEETQKQVKQEALLRSINQKIVSTNNMETAMKVAIREIGQALGANQTMIRLGHHNHPQVAPTPTNGGHTPENDQTDS